jgi:hypothetical protein
MSKAYEYWIRMRDGKLILYRENADYNFLRRGAEEHEREITREEVAERYPEVLAEVDEILAGKRDETSMFTR